MLTPRSGERFRHDFRWPNPALVIEDDIDCLLRIVRELEQIKVARADIFCSFHTVLHPADQALPMLLPKKDQRELGNALSLHECEHFEKFIQRAESTRHEHETYAVFHEAH